MVTVFLMTETGSWKTELDLLVAFLLLFKQPRHLGHAAHLKRVSEGPAWPPPAALGPPPPEWGPCRVPQQGRSPGPGPRAPPPTAVLGPHFALALALRPPAPALTSRSGGRRGHAGPRIPDSPAALMLLRGVHFLPLSVGFYLDYFSSFTFFCVYLATLFLTSFKTM